MLCKIKKLKYYFFKLFKIVLIVKTTLNMKYFYLINSLFLIKISVSFNLRMIKVSDYIVKRLEEKQVKTVFAYPGGANLPIINSLYKNQERIKTIFNRNEQFSAFAATGYAKASKTPGILITTSGPGLTNAITGIQDAYSDGIPLIVISGQVNSGTLNNDAFQECNATAITKSCTKYNKLVTNKDDILIELEKCFHICMSPRRGPVHLDICIDILNSDIEEKSIRPPNSLIKMSRTLQKNNEKIQKLIDYMVFAKAPVIICGQGCHGSTEKLRYFATKNKIPVITTIHGVGNFDEEHPLSLKMCGMHGTKYANYAIQNADLIIGIGYRFDDRTVGNLKKYAPFATAKKAIFHIDNSAVKIEKVKELIPVVTGINMDCNDFFDIINKRYISIEMERDVYLQYIQKLKKCNPLSQYINRTYLNIPYILNKFSTILNEYILNKILDNGDNYTDDYHHKIYITTGVGSHQMYAAQHITYKQPNTLLTSGSLGVMGVGVPYAIGAALANPKASVFCIDGDGSFMMSLQELATIREYKLPIKILIMDNKNLQMVQTWQDMFYDENNYGVELKNPDFCTLAKSFGIKSVKCSKIDEVESVIDKMINYRGPMMVHFNVIKEDCLPFVAPGYGLDEMYT